MNLTLSIEDFIDFTCREFAEAPENLNPHTRFRDLPGWSSLNALIYISSINDEYGVLISSSDLSRCATLGDIYCLIQPSA
jgi:acyl carrier protein